MLQNLFGGLLTTMALPLMNSHGTEFVLIPFALMNLVYIAVIAKLLPETCGRTFHVKYQKCKCFLHESFFFRKFRRTSPTNCQPCSPIPSSA